MRPVTVVENVTAEIFARDILPGRRPVLMKGLGAGWPMVQLAKQSDEAVAGYLKTVDNGRPAEIYFGLPQIKGEFFYGDTLRSFNFEKAAHPISPVVDRILDIRADPNPPSVYIQSIPVEDYLPQIIRDHFIDFLPPSVKPRIWIGNALRVQTHYDLSSNIAMLVAGRRRFTLFPPEQLPNLYVGPFEHTLAGPPVSLASLEDPDFDRHPRFREALDAAEYADLEPGDAVYVPYAWWHHVRSFEPFNILVNYWWNDTPTPFGSPYDTLLHAILNLRDLPAEQRDVWKTMFDYYVFGQHGDPVAHIRPEDQGALGAMTPEKQKDMHRLMVAGMSRAVDPT